MNQFYKRHFLRLLDFTPAEIIALLDLATELKKTRNLAVNSKIGR